MHLYMLIMPLTQSYTTLTEANTALINRNNNTSVSWTEWTGSLNNTASTTGSQDATTLVITDGNWYGPQHPLFVNDNAMQLDASVNLFAKQDAEITERLQLDDQSRARWVIQPKFETPILNFNHNQASGNQQVITIDFAGLRAGTSGLLFSYSNLDTDGQQISNTYYDYADNRIVLYNGLKEFNIYFTRGQGDHDPADLLDEALDPSYLSHLPKPNTIPIAISSNNDDDASVADKIVDALNQSVNPFTAAVDPDTSTKISITSSFKGESLPPELTGRIQTAISSPVIVTSGSVSDLALSPHSPATTTRGMWHQYGLIPTGSDGIFMSISDIPATWQKGAQGIHTFQSTLTASLADLCGFSKEPVRLGEMAPSKLIREAVVAIPFIEEDNEKKFFEIPRRDIENALETDPETRWVGASVVAMVRKMQHYVFPPSIDFLKTESITPFAMYIFEFTHELSKQDLADIWQNLPPEINQSVEEVTSTITHELLSTELLGGGTSAETVPVPAYRNKDPGLELNERIRWMVFKVKQKAQTNYYDKIVKKQGVSDEEEAVRLSKSSFNWPYDFFSLVELVKLDATITFSDIEEADDEGSKVVKTKKSSTTIDRKRATKQPFLNTRRRNRKNIKTKKEI